MVTQTKEPQIKLPLQIFRQRCANRSQSMKRLADNGLRLPTYQEALSHSSELIKEFEGKWFWLCDNHQGIKEDGLFTFNAMGELVKSTGSETLDQRVRVWKGNWPLRLRVSSGTSPNDLGWRFSIYGDYVPQSVADLVVGVVDADSILEKGRATLARLRRGIQG